MPKRVTVADVRAERARHQVTQDELAKALAWPPQVMPPIENGLFLLEEEEYERMIEAVKRAAQEKA